MPRMMRRAGVLDATAPVACKRGHARNVADSIQPASAALVEIGLLAGSGRGA